jgi:hypothetical protein
MAPRQCGTLHDIIVIDLEERRARAGTPHRRAECADRAIACPPRRVRRQRVEFDDRIFEPGMLQR